MAEENELKTTPPVKVLWGQGMIEGKEERALFTVAGYLRENARLVSEVFATTEAFDPVQTNLSPLDFRAALYTLSKTRLAQGEKILALKEKLLQLPLSDWAKRYPKEGEAGLKKAAEEALQGVVAALFPGAQVKLGILIVEEGEYLSWQKEKRKIAASDGAQEENGEDLPQAVTLRMQVAIDPVSGKRIPELVVGEKLLVRIADDRPLAQSIANLLKKSPTLGTGDRLLAEVKEAIQLEPDRYKLIAQFEQGILGECPVSENLKVKVVPDPVLSPEEVPHLLGIPIRISPYMLGEVILLLLLFSFILLARLLP